MKVGDLIYDWDSRERGIIIRESRAQPTIGTQWLVFFNSGCQRYCHSSNLKVLNEV